MTEVLADMDEVIAALSPAAKREFLEWLQKQKSQPVKAKKLLPVPKSAVLLGGVALIGGTLAGAAGIGADLVVRHPDKVADAGRAVVGDETWAKIEEVGLSALDKKAQLDYAVSGGPSTPWVEHQPPQPFVEPPKPPAPFIPPETHPLFSTPQEGEGVWITENMPDPDIMRKTFIRPDLERPFAFVGAVVLDCRYTSLHMTGGTKDPGGDRGVRGPGIIPEDDIGGLLVAWNGGFQGSHGNYGMYADGKEYRPLRDGFASVAVMKDETIKMGEWGRDLKWSDDMVAVRQNAVLLVDKGEISELANKQGDNNKVWGYVYTDSSVFITWRTAIGLTEEGNLIIAAGNNLSAKTLALAMQALGAETAMQLDINTPYSLMTLFSKQPDGSLQAVKFLDWMSNPARFLNQPQERDFMYIVSKK